MLPAPSSRTRAALRIALSHYVTAGVSAALGLVVTTTAVQFFAGAFAASVASVGVLVCIPPDQPAPQRGKSWQLLPAAFLGLPLFVGVQFLHAEPVALGLLVLATGGRCHRFGTARRVELGQHDAHCDLSGFDRGASRKRG